MVRKIFLFTAIIMATLSAMAQESSAVALLESAIGMIKKDAAVQLAFDYVVYDSDGNVQMSDDGSLKLNGDSYALLLTPMKIWCDGKTQWSYVANVNEVYISEAGSEEAQAYNPVYLMGLYKNGYNCTLKHEGGNNVITLTAADDEPYLSKVVISLDAKNNRPVTMNLHIAGQGRTEISVKDYKPGCNFDECVYRCPTEDFPDAEIVDMR